MAGAEGFEPSARGFGDRCSTNWAIPLYSYGNHFDIIHILHHFVNNNYFEMFLWSFFLNLIHNRKNDNNRRRCYCSAKAAIGWCIIDDKDRFPHNFSLVRYLSNQKEKSEKINIQNKKKRQSSHENCRFFGGPSGTRTPDRPVMSRML